MEKDQGTDNQGNRGHNKSDWKHDLGPTGSGDWADANGRRVFPPSPPEFLGDLWIAETILVEIKQVQAQPVLHLALAQIVQVRLPMAILGQIFRHVRRQKNVSGVTAVQHSLGNIDPRTRYVCFLVDIRTSVPRASLARSPFVKPSNTVPSVDSKQGSCLILS